MAGGRAWVARTVGSRAWMTRTAPVSGDCCLSCCGSNQTLLLILFVFLLLVCYNLFVSKRILFSLKFWCLPFYIKKTDHTTCVYVVSILHVSMLWLYYTCVYVLTILHVSMLCQYWRQTSWLSLPLIVIVHHILFRNPDIIHHFFLTYKMVLFRWWVSLILFTLNKYKCITKH